MYIFQIAQDDEGFDLSSVRSSLDFDAEDLEGVPSANPPAYDAPRGSHYNYNNDTPSDAKNNQSSSSYNNRDASPLPAPVPKKPASLPRESLDGETIFAVGGEDDDKWSEDESGDDEEKRGLTGGKRDD